MRDEGIDRGHPAEVISIVKTPMLVPSLKLKLECTYDTNR